MFPNYLQNIYTVFGRVCNTSAWRQILLLLLNMALEYEITNKYNQIVKPILKI